MGWVMSNGWWQPWVPCALLVVITFLATWLNETFGTCCLMFTAAVISLRLQDSPFVPAFPLMIPLVGLVRVSTTIPVAAAMDLPTSTTSSSLAAIIRGGGGAASPLAFIPHGPAPYSLQPHPCSSSNNYHPRRPRGPRPVWAQLDGEGQSSKEASSSSSPSYRPILSRRDMLTGALAAGLSSFVWSSSSSSSSISNPPAARAAGLSDSDVPGTGFKTKSGIKYYDIREGEGASPKWGQVAIIHYEGYCRTTPRAPLVLFDDTYSRNMPYLIKHGNGRIIKGLEEGLHSMKVGGYRRIIVPLALGYTRSALGPFPPNSLRRKILYRELRKAETNEPQGELVFDVELLSAYDDEADQGYYEAETIDNQVVQDGLSKTLSAMGTEGMALPTAKTGRDRFPFNQAEWDTTSLPEVL